MKLYRFSASCLLVAVLFGCGSKSGWDFEKYPEAFPDEVDQLEANMGRLVFTSKCVACHDLDKKVIGPPLRDVTKRRTYRWMMNQIMMPDEWVKINPDAAALYKEYNFTQMLIPDGIEEEQARAVIAYLRREAEKPVGSK